MCGGHTAVVVQALRVRWRDILRDLGRDGDRIDFARARPAYDAFLAAPESERDFDGFAAGAPPLMHGRDPSLTHLPELRAIVVELGDARGRCLERLLAVDDTAADRLLGTVVERRNQLLAQPEDVLDQPLFERIESHLMDVRRATPEEGRVSIQAAFDLAGSHDAFTDARRAARNAEALRSANATYDAAARVLVDACLAPTLHLALDRHQRGSTGLHRLFNGGVVGLRSAADAYSPARGYGFFTYAQWWVRRALIVAEQRMDA